MCRAVSEGWRTQPNHVLLSDFPSSVTATAHVLEKVPCISKPASEMFLGTAADFSLAVLLTHFLETKKKKL